MIALVLDRAWNHHVAARCEHNSNSLVAVAARTAAKAARLNLSHDPYYQPADELSNQGGAPMKYMLFVLLVTVAVVAAILGFEAQPAKASSWYCYVSPYNFWNIYCWQTG